jgi:hypothetical protein
MNDHDCEVQGERSFLAAILMRCLMRKFCFYFAPADLHGWGPTETIARHRRYSMPELIAYLQANAMVSGQPVRLFSR